MDKQNTVSFDKVRFGGFWGAHQKLNREVTVGSVYNRFKDTGRFDAFKCDWQSGKEGRPHIFWDSDVAKWIEGVSYILNAQRDDRLEAIIDEVVTQIGQNADRNGYFNSYYLSIEPYNKFTDRSCHELYCAGHLIEAAIAYDKATGKDKFLKLMCRYADYIKRIFMDEHITPYYTPGHEEIELALVKLYEHTGERRYLELASWFIDERGKHPEVEDPSSDSWQNPSETQDQCPVREMQTAKGHAVRMLYLLCGMADTARENDDAELFEVCRRIFDNISKRRMYITGGVGSSSDGEAFTIDYDLPNMIAYSETCAAIALVLFASRMAALEADSKYADTAERAMYNGMLSGVSLDGRKFFYTNPLEINPGFNRRDVSIRHGSHIKLPITERVEVFGCSCCPPNIVRMLASLGNIFYSESGDTVFVHHYAESEAVFGGVHISTHTDYPSNGKIKLCIDDTSGKKHKIAFRIPGWCERFELTSDAKTVGYEIINGYVYVEFEQNCELDIVFDMPIILTEASARVFADAGKVAVTRGPIVYCAEAVDNGEDLFALAVDKTLNGAKLGEVDKSVMLPSIIVSGKRRVCNTNKLYQRYSEHSESVDIKLIPYFAFANRGESEMRVWFEKY